jgi:hypothetical protein
MPSLRVIPVSHPRLQPLLAGLCVLALGSLVFTLAQMSIDPRITAPAGQHNLAQLRGLWLTAGACWLALTAWWLLLPPASERTHTRVRSTAVILFIALVARLVVIFTHTPMLSDDIYRYLFDGRNLAAGINPYLPVPGERTAAETQAWPGERETVVRINNPPLSTIYLPASQWVFMVGGAIANVFEFDVDAVAITFRLLFVCIELVGMLLIATALAQRNRSAWLLALYAWHPLPLIEIAGSGHQDIIGIVLLLGALVLFAHRPHATWRWTTALAMSILVKPMGLAVAVTMLRRRSLKTWLACAITGVLAGLVIAAPLLLTQNAEPLKHLFDTASQFSLKWASFGSVYEPVLWLTERLHPSINSDTAPNERVARLVCLGLVGLTVAVVFFSRLNVWDAARVLLLAMLLFSTTAHPWYLLWAFALLPIAPSPTIWIASLTMLGTYMVWGYRADDSGHLVWGAPAWTAVAVYFPVYGSLLVDWSRRLLGAPHQAAVQSSLTTNRKDSP